MPLEFKLTALREGIGSTTAKGHRMASPTGVYEQLFPIVDHSGFAIRIFNAPSKQGDLFKGVLFKPKFTDNGKNYEVFRDIADRLSDYDGETAIETHPEFYKEFRHDTHSDLFWQSSLTNAQLFLNTMDHGEVPEEAMKTLEGSATRLGWYGTAVLGLASTALSGYLSLRGVFIMDALLMVAQSTFLIYGAPWKIPSNIPGYHAGRKANSQALKTDPDTALNGFVRNYFPLTQQVDRVGTVSTKLFHDLTERVEESFEGMAAIFPMTNRYKGLAVTFDSTSPELIKQFFGYLLTGENKPELDKLAPVPAVI